MAEQGFKARSEMFEYRTLTILMGFIYVQIYKVFHQNGWDGGGMGCLLKRQSPQAPPAVVSLNL